MSIFSSIKDAAEKAGIIVDEDADKSAEVVAQAAPPQVNSESSTPSTPLTPYKASTQDVAGGVSDPKFVETLNTTIGTVCSEKYLTFLDKKKEMSAIPGMSASTVFQASMIAAVISAEEIRQSQEAMLKKLTDEETAFGNTVEGKHQEFLTQTNNQIQDLNNKIDANNAKIKELNADSDAAITAISSLKTQIADKETRKDNKVSAFRASVAEVRAKVEQDRNQAAQNIPTGGAK